MWIKKEFNNQINASSVVIFIVGDKTRNREAGSVCGKAAGLGFPCCTPYKQNSNGSKACNNYSYNDYFYNNYYSIDVNPINNYSYLRHEFEQAKKKNKKLLFSIILRNIKIHGCLIIWEDMKIMLTLLGLRVIWMDYKL